MRKKVKRIFAGITVVFSLVVFLTNSVSVFAEDKERVPQYEVSAVDELLKQWKAGPANGDFPSMYYVGQQVYTQILQQNIGAIDIVTYKGNSGNDYVINQRWDEGLLGSYQGDYLYCADPTLNFKEGYKISVDARKYYSQETINAVGAFLYYYDNVYQYPHHNYKDKYMIRQCLIWNVLNYVNQWYPGATIEYGNGKVDDAGNNLSDSMGDLLSANGLRWVKAHYKRMNCYGELLEGEGQPLSRWWYNDGWVRVKKSSAKPEITDGSADYSLAGAEYEVYYDEQCKDYAGKCVTGEDGMSDYLNVLNGTCYIKEVKAPKGYKLNGKVEKIMVESETTTVYETKDEPEIFEGKLSLKKSSTTEQSAAGKTADLSGAEYEVYTDKQCLNHVGLLVTDAEGNSNTLTLKKGTYYVKETKAPSGFKIDPEIYPVDITADTPFVLEVSDEPAPPEIPVKIKIIKKVKGKDIPVKDVIFTHVKPDGQKEDIVTDENGQAVIESLDIGSHTIEETKAPAGIMQNPGKISFTVSAEKKVLLLENTSTEESGLMKFEVQKEKNIVLTVEDICTSFNLMICKENENSKKLENAEFTLYKDKNCTKEIEKGVTDKYGMLKFEGLVPDTLYYLKETKAPSGYRVPQKDGSDVIYEIRAQVSPDNFDTEYFVNNKKVPGAVLGAERSVTVKIINNQGMVLPKTGTYQTILLFMLGILCMTGTILFAAKHKKKEE